MVGDDLCWWSLTVGDDLCWWSLTVGDDLLLVMTCVGGV